MRQNFKEITNKVLQGSSKLNNLHDKIKSIKNEGRTPQWESEQITRAIESAKNELKVLAVRRRVDLAYQKELANKVVEPSQDMARRNYHQNKAIALASNMTGDDVIRMYKHIMSKPEAKQFKSEYEDIFLPRLGVEHLTKFDTIRRENMTEDELHQERFMRAINSVGEHLDTIDGLEVSALEDIAVNKYDPYSEAVQHGEFFDAMLDNAEQHANADKPTEPSKEMLDVLDPVSQQ